MNRAFRTIVMLAILTSLFLTGAASISGCSVLCDKGKYHDTMKPLLQKWDDAITLANQTPRMQLAAQIQNLQSIRREVAAVEVQSCLQDTHAILLRAMDLQINGFLSFLAQDPDASVQNYFNQADRTLQEWTDALSKK